MIDAGHLPSAAVCAIVTGPTARCFRFARRYLSVALPVFFALQPVTGTAQGYPRWNDSAGGATKTYYDRAARLPWDRQLGDWRDATDTPWGSTAFASAPVSARSEKQTVSLDVTGLVNHWLRSDLPNEGFYVILDGPNILNVNGRKAAVAAPQLTLQQNGGTRTLTVAMDTFLDNSTGKSLGQRPTLKVSARNPALIWFDLNELTDTPVQRATLRLYVSKVYGHGSSTLNVFGVDPAPASSITPEVETGLAAKYTRDQHIEDDPEVYFATGFESSFWSQPWFVDGLAGDAGDHSGAKNYTALSGNSLAATLREGEKLALNIRFRFSQHDIPEPEAAYFRYYLRFGDNWNQTVSGGKLPGFAGTYRAAGWGSRKPDGTNGWSARGSFLKTIQPDAAFPFPRTPIGNYVYHVDQWSKYGNTWTWSSGEGALLQNNRWYCIEQYLQLNSVDASDGVIKAWIDGKQVFEKSGLRFRTTDRLKIQDVWFNIYHGGTEVSPRDQTTYIDNVVIARDYIGPMGP